jgi:hypothetical protein
VAQDQRQDGLADAAAAQHDELSGKLGMDDMLGHGPAPSTKIDIKKRRAGLS